MSRAAFSSRAGPWGVASVMIQSSAAARSRRYVMGKGWPRASSPPKKLAILGSGSGPAESPRSAPGGVHRFMVAAVCAQLAVSAAGLSQPCGLSIHLGPLCLDLLADLEIRVIGGLVVREGSQVHHETPTIAARVVQSVHHLFQLLEGERWAHL